MMFTDIKFSIIYLVAQQSGFCVDTSDARFVVDFY